MKRTRSVLLASAVAVIWGCDYAFATEASTNDVQAVLNNWRSIKSDFLRDPINSQLLAALRQRATNNHEVEARVLLLNIQDAETIRICLEEFEKDVRYVPGQAANTFALCSEPKLISVFATYLNRDEPGADKKVPAGYAEIARLTPKSVLATRVIIGIIANSPQFNAGLKEWAASLPAKSIAGPDREAARASVRLWWQENEHLFAAGKYDQMKPPSKTPAVTTPTPAATASQH